MRKHNISTVIVSAAMIFATSAFIWGCGNSADKVQDAVGTETAKEINTADDEADNDTVADEEGIVNDESINTDAAGDKNDVGTGDVESKASASAQTMAPAQTATKAPAQTATIVPTQTATKAPAQTATKAPAQTTTKAPAQTATKAPAQTTTKAPAQTATKAPAQTTTKAPAQTATKAPAQTATKAPAQTATKAPTQTATKAPAQTATKAPTQTATKAPTQTATKAPENISDAGVSAGNTDAYVSQVLDLVNKERTAAGLGELTLNQNACKAALVRAKETVSTFSHTRPDGSSCFTALNQAGVSYNYAGENIASGQKTPDEVMNGWMNSSGHRANILSRNFSQIGIACYQYNGVNYWVQMFIG